jgi:hypothetical protein
LDFNHEDEDATETVDPDAVGGPEDQSLMHDRVDDDSFVPNDDEDIVDDDHDDDDNNDNDNDNKLHPTNNDVTLDDEDGGIIMDDGPVKYDNFNIPNTVEHFRMGGRHAVFGLYHQLVKPLKQGRKKLGIICVLCVKALGGTNFEWWTWVKCARVSTNSTTNLLSHLEKKHAKLASVKALVSKKNKKGSVGSGKYTSNRIIPCVDSRYSHSLVYWCHHQEVVLGVGQTGSGTQFAKTCAPSFCGIFVTQISGGYTGLSRQTFNTMIDEDYTYFANCIGTKLRECEDRCLSMRFVDVHHHMFKGPDGNTYLGASCSFIRDFYLNIVALKLTLNNKTHFLEYNAEVLEDSIKADYDFDFPKNAQTIIGDIMNATTKVVEYFSEDMEQVNF